MKLSIIIPVLQDKRIRNCLQSIFADDTALHGEFEVIVVDNGPSDFIRDIVAEFPARYVIENRRGSFAARNLGVEEARGEILAFTDADCIIHPGWIDRIMELFREDNCLAVGPSDSVGRSRVALWVQSVDDARADAVSRNNPIVYCDTRNLAGPRELFRKFRFDPYFIEAGDLEFAWRLTCAGETIRYAPDMRLAHDNPTSLWTTFARSIRRGRWLDVLYLKHGSHVRLSGERELQFFGMNQKHKILSFFRQPFARPFGIAGLTGLFFVFASILLTLQWLHLPWSWGVTPYRIYDRTALLLGILLGITQIPITIQEEEQGAFCQTECRN